MLTELPFSELEYRKFWSEVQRNGHLPYLSRVARLYLTVSTSAIPQNRQFSELKRICDELKNRVKIESMDIDSVVYYRSNTRNS